MQTSKNSNIVTIIAKKHYGKTTIGKYIMESISKPSLIVDIAKQFEDNTPYRIILRGLKELKHYLGNPYYKKSFYSAKLQLIYRFTSDDKQSEAKELFKYINSNLKNILIFCEEMELYADQYLKKSSPIFESFYLARNYGFDIIVICKIIGQLSILIKDQTDYFIVNTNNERAIKYLNERSENKFSKWAKHLKKREFIFTDLDEFYKKFTLKNQIVKLIK